MEHSFRYTDGQVYETDQETLTLMKRLHDLESDPKMVEALEAIRAWDPDAASWSHRIVQQGIENGRIQPQSYEYGQEMLGIQRRLQREPHAIEKVDHQHDQQHHAGRDIDQGNDVSI